VSRKTPLFIVTFLGSKEFARAKAFSRRARVSIEVTVDRGTGALSPALAGQTITNTSDMRHQLSETATGKC
jgi:hypothetical protein